MNWWRDDAASASVMTILLLPVLTVTLAGVLQLGALRVAVARVHAAADLAALVAVNDQDDDELTRTGLLRLAPDAAEVARHYLARELELSEPLLGTSAREIANAADIAAYVLAPAYDARTGMRYDHPTIRIVADVPLRTPVFGALAFRPITVVNVVVTSSPR